MKLQKILSKFQKLHNREIDLSLDRIRLLMSKIGTILSILLKKNSVISSEENETSEDSQSLTKAAS